ncbi:NAD(P)-dependent dehydrogenase (short-subunit alcohol dehydrogenase family) [Arthrobacter roseus]|nr:NAD(P)-dependent dehydrogenase (short-subunit alcohol dehydrogenase family) [Arthrobacter roseus]
MVIGDLKQEQAESAATEITAAGGRAMGLAVDAMDEASIIALVEAAVDKYGALHIMCNHVGGSNPRKDLDLLRLDMDEFDRTMRLNVRSTVVGSRAALPHLIAAGGGSIINTASVGGLSEDFLQVAYGTAKAAVIRLTQYVAITHCHSLGQPRILRRRCCISHPMNPVMSRGNAWWWTVECPATHPLPRTVETSSRRSRRPESKLKQAEQRGP